MDKNVFWNKLSEMDYEDIIHWIEIEDIKGIPFKASRCVLAELGNKVTGDRWTFGGHAFVGDMEASYKIGDFTDGMTRIMLDFDYGKMPQFEIEEQFEGGY